MNESELIRLANERLERMREKSWYWIPEKIKSVPTPEELCGNFMRAKGKSILFVSSEPASVFYKLKYLMGLTEGYAYASIFNPYHDSVNDVIHELNECEAEILWLDAHLGLGNRAVVGPDLVFPIRKVFPNLQIIGWVAEDDGAMIHRFVHSNCKIVTGPSPDVWEQLCNGIE